MFETIHFEVLKQLNNSKIKKFMQDDNGMLTKNE